MINPYNLKSQLPYSWAAFFARYGNFTRVQLEAIPSILAGRNMLMMAATASGKTEAAMAPLLEQHVLGAQRREWTNLRILYICPTRALVRDLYERLSVPLESLRVSLKMKSGDTGKISTHRPPTVLITTPESTDSLLTRVPRLFASLRALVIDEIHLFDHSVRGDHLRCLINRIERIRQYRQQQLGYSFAPLQRIALSATVPDPEGIMERYLANNYPKMVQVAGRRTIVADLLLMESLEDMVEALGLRAARKTLIFCNARNEVEQVAAYLRQHLPYEAAILVHYSNLDPIMRREIEKHFTEATIAICVSSSTLELGVDIGNINDVVLLGPPPSLSSFLQRIGRGARRRQTTPVLCIYRTPLEEVRFQALLDLAEQEPDLASPAPTPPNPSRRSRQALGRGEEEPPPEFAPAEGLGLGEGAGWDASTPDYQFRPSVLVQQIFSFLKQSPTSAIRLADLRRIAPPEAADETLEQIMTHLLENKYLRTGRHGEWRPGPELNKLMDKEEIYSNIDGGGGWFGATMVDAYSGRRIAQMDRMRLKGDTLLMGGNALKVAWRKKNTFAVQRGQEEAAKEVLRFRSAPFAVPLDVTQAIATHLGVKAGQIPRIVDSQGTWLFHFWGDLYGELLAALLQAHVPKWDDAPLIEPWNELCLRLPFTLRDLPAWHEKKAKQELHKLTHRIQRYLGLGHFHSYLPPDLATQTVITHCNLPRFEALYRGATAVRVDAELQEKLLGLT